MTPSTSTAVAIALAFSAVACTNKEPVEPLPAPLPVATPAQSVALAPASLADTVERVIPAVVKVICTKTVTIPFAVKQHPGSSSGKKPPGNTIEAQERTTGTGVVIDKTKGYIITNEHVARNCDTVKILLHGEERRFLPSTIFGRDTQTDIAVLKIDDNKAPAQATLGDDNKLRLGEDVFAIGNPFDFDETVTSGIVSGKNRTLSNIAGPYNKLIQTSVPINSGNSGGPLFNQRGEVVGINTAIYTNGTSMFGGLSFSVPITQAKFVADKLIEKGYVPWGYLDAHIGDLDEQIATKLGRSDLKGVWVIGLGENSPAKGIIKNDDIVLRVNGIEVNRPRDMARNVAETLEGNIVRLDVWRNNQPISLAIRLAPRPAEGTLIRGTPVPK